MRCVASSSRRKYFTWTLTRNLTNRVSHFYRLLRLSMACSGWSTEGQKNSEDNNPVPPYSRCIAIRDFVGKLLRGDEDTYLFWYSGQQPQDLSFRCGEQLTIIEPCNVMYWYLAENSEGKRGIMPINFVKVCMLKYRVIYSLAGQPLLHQKERGSGKWTYICLSQWNASDIIEHDVHYHKTSIRCTCK